MTTTQPIIQNAQLGQVVIVTQSDRAPVTANVTHVTKSGQFKTCKTGDARFKPAKWSGYADELGVGKYNSRHARQVQLHTDEKFAELVRKHEEREAEKAAQRAARDEAEAARQAEWQQKVDHIRSIVPLYKVQLTMLPDGSRLHTYTFDARPITFTTKDDNGIEQTLTEDAGWVWVVIACKDTEEYDWKADGNEKVKKVETATTFRTARSSSFSSVSTDRYATEEEAIYQSLTYAYYKC